jgi:type II secretory pathway component PulF
MLYEKGVRVDEASLIAAKTITNSYLRSIAIRVATRSEYGKNLADLLGQYPKIFPAHMRAIIGVSERSGSLSRSLNEIADHYAKRVSYKSERLPALLEPLLLTAIGILIGFIAVSIILPIYQLSSSLQ